MAKRKPANDGTAAVARRAARAADVLVTQIAAAARKDIAFVQRRRARIAEAFYEIGEALVRLKRREVVAAMRCRSFAELCEMYVGFSPTQADRLVDIVRNMSRADAIAVGATKAASIVALARARPEAGSAAELLRRGLRLDGERVDVKAASARAIAKLAVGVRAGTSRAGRGPTAAERAACAALERALAASGAVDATVTPKAGPRVGEARATIEIAVGDLALLARAARSARA